MKALFAVAIFAALAVATWLALADHGGDAAGSSQAERSRAAPRVPESPAALTPPAASEGATRDTVVPRDASAASSPSRSATPSTSGTPRLRVHVIDQRTGLRLGGIGISLIEGVERSDAESTEFLSKSARIENTRSDGTVVFDHVLAGDAFCAAFGRWTGRTAMLPIRATDRDVDVDLRVQRCPQVVGRVVDERREPIDMARVALRKETDDAVAEGEPSTVTREDGSFELFLAPPKPGERLSIVASQARYSERAMAAVNAVVVDDTPIDVGMLVLRGRVGAVRGRLIFGGSPSDEALVLVLNRVENGRVVDRACGQAVVAGDGTFTIDGLGAGSFEIVLADYCLAGADAFPFERASATQSQDLGEIRADPCALRAAGRCVDSAGTPLAGGTITIGSTSCPIASDGTFTHGICAPRTFDLRVVWTDPAEPGDTLSARMQNVVVRPDAPLDVRVPRTGLLFRFVRDGKPLAVGRRASVRIERADGGTSSISVDDVGTCLRLQDSATWTESEVVNCTVTIPGFQPATVQVAIDGTLATAEKIVPVELHE